MKSIRVAILDDNKTALGAVEASVASIFRERGYEPQTECFETLHALRQAPPCDLYLLDISVPDGDGIRFARELRDGGSMADIIFVSSREDKVFDALQVHPYGFIRKSKFLNDVSSVISGYIDECTARESGRALIVMARGQTLRLDIDDILYIESAGRTQNVFLGSRPEPVPVSESMENLEGLLSREGFLRTHKGYLVNCRYIRLITNSDVRLLNDCCVPVSRRKLTELKEAYLAYMQGQGAKMFD